MKGERFLLWLMIFLIGFNCFVALEVFPEFYAPSLPKMQELVRPLSGDLKGVVQGELFHARWSGVNAQYLAECTLGVNAVLFFIVGSLIVKSYRKRKDAA
ncbi:MAG TPA: hypothetical protein VKU37_00815 [Verrucomicrobiae bacterium]|nr:hypothetical protein [Verrucomicrobiae bacterium]